MLADGEGAAGAIVEAYANHSLRMLPLVPLDVPAGKVLQLWSDGAPLGVFPRAAEGTLQGPELPAPQAGRSYEITLEDAPGTSSGRPRGPVVLSGQAVLPPR